MPGNQGGYLHEIPLLTVLVVMASVVLINVLSAPWHLIPLAAMAVAVIFFLYYNFVRAGWLPGKSRGESSEETDIPDKHH